MKLRMLVNCAGVIDRKKFLDLTPEEIEAIVKVNIFAQVFMTKNARAVMPSEQINAIVHFSSILGDMGLPYHALYSGTKTFNRVFGRLTYQNQLTNPPDTLIVKPSTTTTAMTGYQKDVTSVLPEEVALGMFRELGLDDNKRYSETGGAFKHCVQGASIKYVPDIANHVMRQQSLKYFPKY